MEITPSVKVAVLFGGRYAEHDVSIYSFVNFYGDIQSAPPARDISLTSIHYITREGTVLISRVDLTRDAGYYFAPERKAESTVPELFSRVKEADEFVYLICDGPSGKDGRYTAFAEALGIRGTFGSPLGFALSRSKFHMNRFVSGNYSGIHLPETRYVKTAGQAADACGVFGQKTIVVKSNSLGSSIHTRMFDLGRDSVRKVAALCEQILKLDGTALIQEHVRGDEFGCYCLEKEGAVDVLAVKKFSSTGLVLDAREKYAASERSHDEYMAHPPEQLTDFASALFVDADLRNLSRMDFILDRDGKIHFLENNANPALRGFVDAYTRKYDSATGYDLLRIFVKNELGRRQVRTDYYLDIF